ncbi:MAG TPA: gluconolaconase [Blastocatellia bacterium]|nr:gluconolaconase [Blastocatellia bacterium]
MRKTLIVITAVALLGVAAFFVYLYATKPKPTNANAVGRVTTYAGTGAPGSADGPRQAASFGDPFGVAADRRGNVLVSDGATSRIRLITPQGEVKTIAGAGEGYADGPALEAQFNTPSAIAFDAAGNLIIADTANNRIRKLSADYQTVSTIAGSGAQGFKDGAAGAAQFDGPIGVAVDRQGNVYVADTYNDRVRKITADGNVTTLAGAGTPGMQDGEATAAMFDTPCGVAVDAQGNVFVADTANRAVRLVSPTGEVTTVKQSPQHRGDGDGLDMARLERPMGLALTHDGFLFVADRGSHTLVRIAPNGSAALYAGWLWIPENDVVSRIDSPTGIALDREGNLFVADSQNYLIKKAAPVLSAAQANESAAQSPSSESRLFIQPSTEPVNTEAGAIIPRLDASVLNITQPMPWPVAPQNQWHEVTGVVGEARGNFNGTALDHLHAGLDVRGVMGEPCLSVYDEKVADPLASWGFQQSGEGLHVGAFSYIHIRVGRDANGQLQAPDKFKARLDSSGKLAGIRVRRGARFRVGDFLGTLNQLYHVHLNLGPWNAIANPIQLPFVAFKDTVAPLIEPNGIEVVKAADPQQPAEAFKEKRDGRLVVSGDVQIQVAAYDRVDGNLASRKLGLYRAGYQLLNADGSPVAGFDRPLVNIEFNRLPPDDDDVTVAYAVGSGVSAYGTPTRFKYIVTNRVRDGQARRGLLRTSQLAPGNYLIRIFAADYAGNRAAGPTTELPITISH